MLDANAGIDSQILRQSLDHSQRRAAAILDLYDVKSPEGREDAVDILLHIIDMEGKVGKYFLTEAECDCIKSFYAQSNREIVARFFGENWPNPELFSYVKPPIIDVSAESIEIVIPLRLEAILSTKGYRTWNGHALNGKNLAGVAARADGWSNSIESGMRCDTSEATLRFRLTWKHFNFMHTMLALIIEAQTSEDYINSNIVVNDDNLGTHDLRRLRIDLPLSLLRPLGLIDVVIRHHFTSPEVSGRINSTSDQSRFTLNRLEYSPI